MSVQPANSPMDKTFFGHPRGLATLFMTEMFERFSYYGGRALLILYMTDAVLHHGLGLTVATAGALYGTYVAMVYMTNLPGGWLADRFLGARRAVFWGGVIIALGNLCLTFPSREMFYLGLGLITIGTGLLKPNVSTMVGALYGDDHTRRDSGFSIFYMGINLGALIAPFVTGWLGQNIQWRYGFGAVTVGMVLGLIQYRWIGAKYLGDAGLQVQQGTPEEHAKDVRTLRIGLSLLAAVIVIPLVLTVTGLASVTIGRVSDVVGILLVLMPVLYFGGLFVKGGWSPVERKRIYAIIVFYFAAAVFWAGFEQAGSTLNLFADRYTHNAVFGLGFPSSWWQAVGPLFVVTMAPLFGMAWLWLGKRKAEPSTPTKFALGLLFSGLAYLLMVPAALHITHGDPGTRVGIQWLLGFYFVQELGELSLSPVGLSAMTKLAPARIVGQMMGIWFLADATGNFIAGRVAGLFASVPLQQIFFGVSCGTLAAAVIMFLLIRPMKELMGGVH